MYLKAESLGAWVRMLQQSGRQIYAPKKRDQQVDFVRLEPGEVLTDLVDDVVQTVQSPKFALFPRVEELFRFGTGKPGRLRERQWNDLPETVLLGVRPCDAAAFSALEAIFMWDTTDAPFRPKRKDKLFVVGLSCRQADEYCFCTSLGGGPGDSRGSDILLTRMDNGDFLVEVVSGRGKSLVQLAEDLFAPAAAVDKESCWPRWRKSLTAGSWKKR